MSTETRLAAKDPDYKGARARILAALREEGPMTTVEIMHRLKSAFPAYVIRKAANYLGDDKEIVRNGATKPWRIAE